MNAWTVGIAFVSLTWFMLDNPDKPIGWSSTAIELSLVLTGIATLVNITMWAAEHGLAH